MKKYFKLLMDLAFAVFICQHSYAQWILANSGTNEHLVTIASSIEGTILCGGWNGSVFSSVDHGETWTSKAVSTEGFTHIDIYNNLCFAVTDNGIIYKSEDSGNSWQLIINVGAKMRGLEIQSPEQIFVCGEFESVFESNNQGSSWDYIPYITGKNWLRDITFPDKQNGYIVGDDGRAYKTPNFGYGWFLMNTGVVTNLTSASFPASDTGYVCGTGGTIIKTTDGGITFNSAYSGSIQELRNVYFLSATDGYVSASNGIILHTIDGGINWELEETSTTSHLREFCYLADVGRLIVCGHDGTILYKDISVGFGKHQDQKKTYAEVIVFPNPGKDKVSFQISGLFETKNTLSVFSADLKEIISIDNIKNGIVDIDFSSYPKGIYFFKLIESRQLVSSGKFVIE